MLCVFPAVTLSGSGGELFRGFLVQARSMADGSPVGVFTDNGDDQTLSSCSPPEVCKGPFQCLYSAHLLISCLAQMCGCACVLYSIYKCGLYL